VQWLGSNPEAAKEEFEHQQKELEGICAPIMQKMYAGMGGQGGAGGDAAGMGGMPSGFPGAGAAPAGGASRPAPSAGPKVEEVD
jgi:L1 cell adhesion molecule like protein